MFSTFSYVEMLQTFVGTQRISQEYVQVDLENLS